MCGQKLATLVILLSICFASSANSSQSAVAAFLDGQRSASLTGHEHLKVGGAKSNDEQLLKSEIQKFSDAAARAREALLNRGTKSNEQIASEQWRDLVLLASSLLESHGIPHLIVFTREISPDGEFFIELSRDGSHPLNRYAATQWSNHEIKVIYHPRELIRLHSQAASRWSWDVVDSYQLILSDKNISLLSADTREVAHELIHIMDIKKEHNRIVFPLAGRVQIKKKVVGGSGTYAGGFLLDELLTHESDIRILFGEARQNWQNKGFSGQEVTAFETPLNEILERSLRASEMAITSIYAISTLSNIVATRGSSIQTERDNVNIRTNYSGRDLKEAQINIGISKEGRGSVRVTADLQLIVPRLSGAAENVEIGIPLVKSSGIHDPKNLKYLQEQIGLLKSAISDRNQFFIAIEEFTREMYQEPSVTKRKKGLDALVKMTAPRPEPGEPGYHPLPDDYFKKRWPFR